MRGRVDSQGGMFFYFRPEQRVPADHPLRSIKARADAALSAISADLEAYYSHTGRPSIAREQLVDSDVARSFFNAVLAQARTEGLLSTEHFTVDATLIEALASLKSLKRRGE